MDSSTSTWGYPFEPEVTHLDVCSTHVKEGLRSLLEAITTSGSRLTPDRRSSRAHHHVRVSAAQAQPICPVCQDRIGVYEPIRVVGDETGAITSLAREPQLRSGQRELMHLACAQTRD